MCVGNGYWVLSSTHILGQHCVGTQWVGTGYYLVSTDRVGGRRPVATGISLAVTDGSTMVWFRRINQINGKFGQSKRINKKGSHADLVNGSGVGG